MAKGIWWNTYFKALPPEQQLLIAANTPVDRVPEHLRKAALTIVAEHTRLQQISARCEKESSYQRWITTPSYRSPLTHSIDPTLRLLWFRDSNKLAAITEELSSL